MLRFDVILSGFNKDILCNLIVTDIVLNQFSKKSNIFFLPKNKKINKWFSVIQDLIKERE